MHNATTKQRHAALRRKLGIFLGAPRWVRQKRERFARLREEIERALSPTPSAGPALGAPEDVLEADATERPTPPFGTARGTATEPARTPPIPYVAAGSPRRRAMEWPPTRWIVAVAIASVVAVLAFSILRDATPFSELAAVGAAVPAPTRAAAPAAAAPAAPAAERVAPAAPAAPAPPAKATIVRGDTLWRLAARYLGAPGRWPRLWDANRAAVRDPDLIYPGQVLTVPAAATGGD